MVTIYDYPLEVFNLRPAVRSALNDAGYLTLGDLRAAAGRDLGRELYRHVTRKSLTDILMLLFTVHSATMVAADKEAAQ